MTKVCILTAGRGTRLGNYGKIINKAILPIREKAIISHILRLFSQKDEFIIAVGYRSDDVKNYIKIAHPNHKVKFVEVKNYKGIGSGPGRSLLYCKKLLQEEFFFIPCDIYTNINLEIKKNLKNNIFWCSKLNEKITNNYLNFKQNKMKISSFVDKKKVKGKNYYSWSGLCYIKDYKIFWSSLESRKNKIDNEYQISNGFLNLIEKKNCIIKKIKWKDVGNYKNYEFEKNKLQKFDFSKDKEFIYFINNKVIKFSKNKIEAKNKYLKFKLAKKNYPKNTNYLKNFLFYDYINGHNFYDIVNKKNLLNLLLYLQKNLWFKKIIKKNYFKKKCYNFYKNKTFKRANLFLKNMKKVDRIKKVNNLNVPSINKILKRIDWKSFSNGRPSYIHGDLQFDNIIKTKSNFKLIDWRSDFDGIINYGDIHYDFAKMLGGIFINYKEVKNNNFFVKKNFSTNSYKIRFPKSKNSNEILPVLKEFIVKNKISYKKIEILQGLIYLNMSPLHKPPFSIGLFLLAKYLLTKKVMLKK